MFSQIFTVLLLTVKRRDNHILAAVEWANKREHPLLAYYSPLIQTQTNNGCNIDKP